jgi:low affinity Fe/Cu permease
VLVVVLWVPTLWVLPSVDTWQLVINTVTTIITCLLVVLLQNTQSRADPAV